VFPGDSRRHEAIGVDHSCGVGSGGGGGATVVVAWSPVKGMAGGGWI
jgi:hypothetical protein